MESHLTGSDILLNVQNLCFLPRKPVELNICWHGLDTWHAWSLYDKIHRLLLFTIMNFWT